MKLCVVLVLLLALASGAVAGGTMHAGEQGCAMMDMPDCCEIAHSQADDPVVSAAKLCCSLNCTMPGSTGQTGSSVPLPQVLVSFTHALSLYPPSSLSVGLLTRDRISPEPFNKSHPVYIRHLALLI